MSLIQQSPPPASPPSLSAAGTTGRPFRTLPVATAGTALVMAVFSAFVVTAGDSVRALHAGVASEAWALSAMALGLAAALLSAGALADDLGHRSVFRWSAGLLAAASALGALASSVEILVAARVLQGVAGAGILAAGLGSIGRTFPSGAARARATSIWGAAIGAGVTIGPLAGAALADPIGWRSGFWVEAAAAGALMAGASSLAPSPTSTRRRLDFPGIATLAAAMTLLIAALVETRNGWSAATTLALFAGSALMLTAFAGTQLRSLRPMLDPRLLAEPQFLASISGALFTGLAVVGLMSYAPALMQQSLHLTVLGSAAVLAAWSATSMVVALSSGTLATRIPARQRLLIGLGLAAIGELALTGLGGATGWMRLVPGLLVTGAGTGIVNAALGRIAVESVPPGRAGMGSGANNTARYLGGAAGAALMVSLASAGGAHALLDGWNRAALVSAGLCALGVILVAICRNWRGRAAHQPALRTGTPAPLCVPESTVAN